MRRWILLLTLVALVGCIESDSNERELDALERENKRLNRDVNSMKDKMDDLTVEVEYLTMQYRELQRDMREVVRKRAAAPPTYPLPGVRRDPVSRMPESLEEGPYVFVDDVPVEELEPVTPPVREVPEPVSPPTPPVVREASMEPVTVTPAPSEPAAPPALPAPPKTSPKPVEPEPAPSAPEPVAPPAVVDPPPAAPAEQAPQAALEATEQTTKLVQPEPARSTRTNGRPDIDVINSEFQEKGDFFRLVGEVKNNTSDNIKHVKIVVSFYDKDDKLLDTESTYVNEGDAIQPKQVLPFSVRVEKNWKIVRYKLQITGKRVE